MTRTYAGLAFLAALILPVAAGAADMAVKAPPATTDVPQGAFYVGLGGSFNSADFGSQNVFALGTSTIVDNSGNVTGSGSAAGPAVIHMNGAEPALAPSVQAGYFHKFSGSDWLWGAKFSYDDLRNIATNTNVLLPQAGSTTLMGHTIQFTGTAVVNTYQTVIEKQMALTAFIGHSFDKGFLYLGAGPTLSQTQTNVIGIVGFANVFGFPQDISGPPQDFFKSGWVGGGSATIGATYFLDSSWFLDVNYTYAQTANKTFDYFSTFVNPVVTGTNNGTFVGNSSGHVITQAVAVTINKAFW